MRKLMLILLVACPAIIGLILPVRALSPVQSPGQTGQAVFESYFNYIGSRPDQGGTNYAEQVQGITHDSNNWFISQMWGLWKIPVGLDLAEPIECGVAGVICAHSDDLNTLGSLGYDHIGDIDHYQFDASAGFVLLPLEDLEGDTHATPAIAVFDATTLRYITLTELSAPLHTSASWVAIGPDGLVYTSSFAEFGWVYLYRLDWDKLVQNGELSLQYESKFELLDESGELLPLGPQGGVLSPSGKLLYITNGTWKDYDNHKDGISVFDMQTGRRIAHSTKAAGEPFWFGYETGLMSQEEPEGLTIWDLDDGGAPGISGQLHVLVLDLGAGADDVYIRHFTDKIYVDGDYSGEELGDPTQPFNTIGEAYAMAWDGARISIKTGIYPEALTFAKQLALLASEGPVTIGVESRAVLSPPGAINLSPNGTFRIH